MAPAKTGSLRRSKKAVIKRDHTNKGNRSKVIPGVRILIIVVINLIEARIEEAPARCRENIARSTEPPACAIFLDKGG
nr:hypothetical protein [Salmonella sp. S146_54837]